MTNSAVNSLINPTPPRSDQMFNASNARADLDRSRDHADRFDDYIEDDYADYEPARDTIQNRDSRDDDLARNEDTPDTERFDNHEQEDWASKNSQNDESPSSDRPDRPDREDASSTTEPDKSGDRDGLETAKASDQTEETENTKESGTPSDRATVHTVAMPNTVPTNSLLTPTPGDGLPGAAGSAHPTSEIPTLGQGPIGTAPSVSQQTVPNSNGAALSPTPSATAEQAPAQTPNAQGTLPPTPPAQQISSIPQDAANNGQIPSAPALAASNGQQATGPSNSGPASSTATATPNSVGTGSGAEEFAATVTNSGADLRKEIAGQNKPQDGNAVSQTPAQNQSVKNGDTSQVQNLAQAAQTTLNKTTSEPASLLTSTAPESTSIDLRTQPLGTLTDFTRPIEKQPMVVTLRAATSGGNPSLPVDTLALHISRNLSNGVNKFQIRLDPPELGRIDVKMEVGQDGRVQTTLAADRPETLDLLQRDAKLLQRALEDAGLKSDNGSLNFSLRDQEGNSGQSANMGSHDDADPTQDGQEAQPEIAENAAHYIADLDAGRVDIRI